METMGCEKGFLSQFSLGDSYIYCALVSFLNPPQSFGDSKQLLCLTHRTVEGVATVGISRSFITLARQR